MMILALALAAAVPAQTLAPAACPAISIKQVVQRSPLVRLEVSLDPSVEDVLFNWSVSTGTIVSGQGTDGINIDQPNDEYLTATVEIMGLKPDCPSIASITLDPPSSPKPKN